MQRDFDERKDHFVDNRDRRARKIEAGEEIKSDQAFDLASCSFYAVIPAI